MTPRRRKQIGFVPQSPALLPWRTVEANARLLLDINRVGVADAPRRRRSTICSTRSASATFADAYPHELSGGMQQRVGLVRAFALDAPILLMDEPFAALDEITRTDMRHLLGRLCEPLGTTVVFVTHSIAEAAFLSDRVAVMSARPGRITEHRRHRPRPTHDCPSSRTPTEFFDVTTRLRRALRDGCER